MIQYFQKFPIIAYDLSTDGTDPKAARDIVHRAAFFDVVKNNSFIMYDYQVKDGETPEIIASKLYDSSQYHWIVLYANEVYNIWDQWPLSYDQFEALLVKKYGSIAASQSSIHHYEDKYGNVIDLDTYNSTIPDGSVRIYTYEYEVSVNDAKRSIKLLDKKYVPIVEREINSLLQKG